MENSNIPAFPVKLRDGEKYDGHSNIDGLTKREYFAGLAMQGMMAHNGPYGITNGPGNIAERSVEIADALLVELDKY